MTMGRAVVVGGGVAGCATALVLAGISAEVLLRERDDDPCRSAGAALALAPNGLAVLDGLGVGDAVRAAGVRYTTGGAIRDVNGRALAPIDAPQWGAGYDHLVIVHRRALLEILYEAVRAQPRIALELGAEVSSNDVPEADIVVAADGIGSNTRAGIVAGAEVRSLDTTYMRALLAVETPPDLVGEWWTREGLIGVLPARGGTYCYASADAPALRAALAQRDIAGFRDGWAQVAPRLAGVLGGLTAFEQLLVNDVADVRANTFAGARGVLVGDAAHAMAPNLGQGANSALVDAAVLAHELSTRDDIAGALAAYDARRRPAVQRVQRVARTLLRLSKPHGGAYLATRNAFLRVTARTASSRRTTHAVLQEEPAQLARMTAELVRR